MSSCPFCKKSMPDWRRIREHIIITRGDDKDGKSLLHVHVPDNSQKVRKLMQEGINYLGLGKDLEYPVAHTGKLPEKVFLQNFNRIGDCVAMTGAVRTFCLTFPHIKVGVASKAMHLWDHNPRICYDMEGVEPTQIGPKDGTNASGRMLVNLVRAFEMCIERELRVNLPPGLPYGDLWFSEEEYRETPEIDGPYWIIVGGGSGGSWGLKWWAREWWQQVVDDNPHIKFVQCGNKNETKVLSGGNVVDMIGKTECPNTGIRRLLKLFLNAQGSIGLVSAHLHISSALNKPHIVLGQAREPVIFTYGYGSRYLSSEGCLPCSSGHACWHCDTITKGKDGKEKFNCEYMVTQAGVNDGKPYPMCAGLITPEDVSRALRMYYDGGRLQYDVPMPKFDAKGNCLYRNIAPGQGRMHPHLSNKRLPEREDIEKEWIEPNWVGFDGKLMLMSGGALTYRDWAFIISDVIEKY